MVDVLGEWRGEDSRLGGLSFVRAWWLQGGGRQLGFRGG